MKSVVFIGAALVFSNAAHARVEIQTNSLKNGAEVTIKSDDPVECKEAIINYVKDNKRHVIAAEAVCGSSAEREVGVGFRGIPSTASDEERRIIEEENRQAKEDARIENERLHAEWVASLPYRAQILIDTKQ
jgi:hypothetical protein